MHDESVTISLSSDEALVLFELLSRYMEDERLSLVHRAEEFALWRLHGALEKTLVAPLEPNYLEVLAAARDRVAPSEG